MDPIKTANTIKELIKMHHWVEDNPPSSLSLRQTLTRHTPLAVTVPLLFYNTYLIQGLTILGVHINSAEAVEARASEIGEILREEGIKRNGIISALCEVWRDEMRDQILKQWPAHDEPAWGQGADAGGLLQQVGAGLLTISVRYRITRIEKHTFNERGSKKGDADYYANKGVLLTEIDLGISSHGNIEIYSTHLFNGGISNTPPDRERLPRQRKQLNELVQFMKTTHNSSNVAIIVGDFNIPEYSAGYNDLIQLMQQIDMVDLWKKRNGESGYTSDLLNKSGICSIDRDERYCNDLTYNDHSNRIDYIFVERPKRTHCIMVDFTRPRRRPFPRMPGTSEYNSIKFMSDHVGIETTLVVNPR